MYPKLSISLEGIENNARIIQKLCSDHGIQITAVLKSSNSYENSYLPIAQAMKKGGIHYFGDSRMGTLARMREMGFSDPLMLIRLPMLSEMEELVGYADASLNSEETTLRAINEEALKQEKVHGVLLMVDLGDLREGIEDEKELMEMAQLCEDLPGLDLLGIGTNLGCYGAIVPDEINLGRLVELAEKIEERIGRRLALISGGATSTLPLVVAGKCPRRINHLRLGEGILLARDVEEIWKVTIAGLRRDNYVIEAQVIEVKEKPSHPIGRIFVDAFGNTPSYEDRGRIRRCLIALGKRDIGDFDALTPLTKGMEILGGSSDHGIIDISHVEEEIKVGDFLQFNLYYQAMMHSIESCSVSIEYRGK
ncbi:MAG: alanine/ornithine racemase family PLP-dependent enzyme [Tissierellia bacterium]|nr:alanine/ornithine racemase family PLP-dependent enzyme [Tissierellia bacterium]